MRQDVLDDHAFDRMQQALDCRTIRHLSHEAFDVGTLYQVPCQDLLIEVLDGHVRRRDSKGCGAVVRIGMVMLIVQEARCLTGQPMEGYQWSPT